MSIEQSNLGEKNKKVVLNVLEMRSDVFADYSDMLDNPEVINSLIAKYNSSVQEFNQIYNLDEQADKIAAFILKCLKNFEPSVKTSETDISKPGETTDHIINRKTPDRGGSQFGNPILDKPL